MTNDDYVLIVSTVADVATDEVVKRLRQLGSRVVRLNTEAYPFSSTLAFKPGRDDPNPFSFDGAWMRPPASIWYRRIRSPAIPEGMDPGIYDFCLRETRALLTGAVIGCETRWMSHPTNLWQAEHKPYQLVLAQEMGLDIPRTVITNDPSLILESFNTFGGMVVKAVRSGHLVSGGNDFAIYTSEVLKEHLTELEQAKLSPAIYQELITKKFHVRVTVVGNQIFVAHIDSQTDDAAAVDWRKTDNPALPHYRAELPDVIKERVFKMVAKCGLQFAAIDFVLTPSNEYVFLELNPSGQWLWLDDQLDLGISDAIARWLSQPACH